VASSRDRLDAGQLDPEDILTLNYNEGQLDAMDVLAPENLKLLFELIYYFFCSYIIFVFSKTAEYFIADFSH